ncbi:MAG: hypothetical protein M3Q97_07425 [Bacteroidota bacterium]|nr:hypothetical protein [Bacteroidota bacterium]
MNIHLKRFLLILFTYLLLGAFIDFVVYDDYVSGREIGKLTFTAILLALALTATLPFLKKRQE